MKPAQEQLDIIKRGTVEIIQLDELKKKVAQLWRGLNSR